MSGHALFVLYFSLGISFIGFAQLYLLKKIQRFLVGSRLRPQQRQLVYGVVCAVFVLMYLPYPLRFIYKWPEREVSAVVLYGLLYPLSLWGIASVSTFLVVGLGDLVAGVGLRLDRLWRREHPVVTGHGESLHSSRREFLRWSFRAVVSTPVGLCAYGAAIGKERYEIVERPVTLPGLSSALKGLRLVQLTDIHVGNFMKQDKLEWYVRAVNDLKPDLIALTGDFIGSSAEFVPACATALEKLEAPLGVFACLGNHDYWVGPRQITEALRAAGVQVLRNEAQTLSVQGARINIAGVDDPWRGTPDFARALSMANPEVPTVMLCHQPDLFPTAVRHGVELTLAGHYHGGQVKLQFFGMTVSPAHLVTVFVEGHYRRGRSQLYVSRGIGTTGPPVRLNAPPEITLLHLA